MHTQTEQSERNWRGWAIDGAGVVGIGLYGATLGLEALLGSAVRWCLGYVSAALLGLFLPLGLDLTTIAWLCAVAPLVWSLVGLPLAGRGGLWAWRLGARRFTEEEREQLDDALQMLRSVEPEVVGPVRAYVLDEGVEWAAVRGRVLLISRDLLEGGYLAPVLAHELGHVESLDGRLTEALARLAFWDDPLGPPKDEDDPDQMYGDPPGGFVWGCLRWMLRLSGGGFAHHLLSPIWAAYWRRREFAADAHAASLGQAEDLAVYLRERELPFDRPPRRRLVNRAEHPPVALRIERLLEAAGDDGGENL